MAISLAVWVAAASWGSVVAQAGPAPPERAFDIPPQPLTSAVEAYAAFTGVQIIYDRPIGAPMSSPGAKGLLTQQAALERLLAGTGLVARFTDANNAVLEPMGGSPPPNLARLTLDPLRVQGALVLEPISRGPDFDFYGRLVQDRLRRALAENPKIARGAYEAELDLEIGPDGSIRRAALAKSSGEAPRDRDILAAVVRLVIDQPPPPDLPQPIRIAVKSRTQP